MVRGKLEDLVVRGKLEGRSAGAGPLNDTTVAESQGTTGPNCGGGGLSDVRCNHFCSRISVRKKIYLLFPFRCEGQGAEVNHFPTTHCKIPRPRQDLRE